MNNRKILITSALPYVNNVPHLGNIIGSVLSADVYARFCRNRGYDVYFVGGTDEYGTASEVAAIKENTTPREICNKYHAIHAEIYEWFNISFTKFGRTSEPIHTEITQNIFEKCQKNGFITESETDQLWCPKCQKFLADLFVCGVCPICKMPGARGDQCDSCQNIYNSTLLIDPICQMPNCGGFPIIKKTNHVFLNLPALKSQIASQNMSNWNKQTISITNSWLSGELTSRSISRDISWGVPVPGFEKKVFYVWFDAPIGYISIIPDWQKWWQNPEVELYQFMGKDNVAFHSIMFPATLFATGEKWTPIKSIECTSYLNFENQKFSKSRGVGIFGDAAMKSGVPSYAWRYYLISIRPDASDSNFSREEFNSKINNELLTNLGNLVNRILKFAKKNFNCVPDFEIPSLECQYWEKYFNNYIEIMENRNIKGGLQYLMKISKKINEKWQKCTPWIKTHENCINTFLALINAVATLAEPFIPTFSSELLKQLNLAQTPLINNWLLSFAIQPGHLLGDNLAPIVSKINYK